jgi:phosphoribosylanthranilate isomerase
MVHVKICGVRSAEAARACVELGASAVGVNLVASSPRCVDRSAALAIARAVHAANDANGGTSKAIVVGVVADMSLDDMRALVRDAELDCLQLHGDETPDTLAALLPHAYKATRIAVAADVERARTYPGEHLLVDAKVEGLLGGSGTAFDWELVKGLARERRLTLAGGLHPDNVERAVRELRPYCVDVASGVEPAGSPGEKDLAKVRAFIEAARRA